ncbi:MAG: hypothetical protein ACE37N_03485 [Pseudohongiellaceae bacterium]
MQFPRVLFYQFMDEPHDVIGQLTASGVGFGNRSNEPLIEQIRPYQLQALTSRRGSLLPGHVSSGAGGRFRGLTLSCRDKPRVAIFIDTTVPVLKPQLTADLQQHFQHCPLSATEIVQHTKGGTNGTEQRQYAEIFMRRDLLDYAGQKASPIKFCATLDKEISQGKFPHRSTRAPRGLL